MTYEEMTELQERLDRAKSTYRKIQVIDSTLKMLITDEVDAIELHLRNGIGYHIISVTDILRETMIQGLNKQRDELEKELEKF